LFVYIVIVVINVTKIDYFSVTKLE